MTDELRGRFESEAVPHLRAVYGLALRLSRREDEAGDLTQDTFLRAYDRFAHFTAGTNCKAWLFSIAYSIFVNRYRKNRRGPELVSIDEGDRSGDAGIPAPSGQPGHAARARVATEAAVEAALAGLPEPFRFAIVLVDVEDLTYEEAAGAIACPLGTLRSRLFRARKLLAAALRQYDLNAGAERAR
jgi:RNA polymerase sigma-70 factor (ECF subfamily)